MIAEREPPITDGREHPKMKQKKNKFKFYLEKQILTMTCPCVQEVSDALKIKS
jgi:hypothetical protein